MSSNIGSDDLSILNVLQLLQKKFETPYSLFKIWMEQTKIIRRIHFACWRLMDRELGLLAAIFLTKIEERLLSIEKQDLHLQEDLWNQFTLSIDPVKEKPHICKSGLIAIQQEEKELLLLTLPTWDQLCDPYCEWAKESVFCMTLYREMWQSLIAMLNCLKIEDEIIKEDSTSYPSTSKKDGNTYMSSTIATTIIPNADAVFSMESLLNPDVEQGMANGQLNSQRNTSTISQYTCLQQQGVLYKSKSADRFGDCLVQLKIFRKSDLNGVNSDRWWMHAKRRIQVVLGHQDGIAMKALNTLVNVSEQIVKESKNFIEEDPRSIPYYSGSK